MDVLDAGTLGYQIGAAGIIVFTLCFIVAVRWWTDWLGRVLAGVLTSTSAVLVVIVVRQVRPDWEGAFLAWRAFVFWTFGLSVWAGWATFIWAQFFAPRLKNTRLRRVPDHTKGITDEEADLADRSDYRDGGLHDCSGSAR